MRRQDRQITNLADILAILNRCEVLRLALCANNQPYIVPMNFAYQLIDDKVVIYLHCASFGTKVDIMRKNNSVCFEADCFYQALKDQVACNWSAEYESVIGQGVISELQDEPQKTHALNTLMKRHGYPGTPHYDPQQLAAVTVLKITVNSITAKRNIRP